MRALFPRWSNTVVRAGVVLLLATPLLVVALLMALVRTPYVQQYRDPLEQPVEMDHRHHVRDDEIDCRYCHFLVERSRYAGVPPTELCMGCHNQVWNDSPQLRPVRESYFSGRPIRWQRVNNLPDFVYFDHAAHVRRGVGCSSCHGRVDLMATVYQPVPMTMAWCLDCHRDPEPHLRPQSRITDMEWQLEPRFSTGLVINAVPERAHISGDVERAEGAPEIRPPTNCTGCHR